jgi:hypothetical protein
VLAAVLRSRQGELYVALLSPSPQARDATFALSPTLLQSAHRYRFSNLFNADEKTVQAEADTLAGGVPVTFAPEELKVLKITPEVP